MSTQIDRAGAFRAKIIESGLATTKNTGMPQFVAEFKATQYYVQDPALFEHFGLTEAGWVDWSAYDQSLIGYLQLIYADKKNNGALTPMFHVEGLMRATGWDGTSLAKLGEGNYSDREVTIWVEENEYNGKVSLRVEGIDAGDASPHRGGVRALDKNELTALDAQFAGVFAGVATPTKTAAAKPPAKGPAAPKPAAAPAAAPPAPAAAASATAPAATAPAPAAATAGDEVPTSLTKGEAWAAVCAVDGISDEARTDAWVNAAQDIITDGDEDAATNEQWAAVAVRARTILDCPF